MAVNIVLPAFVKEFLDFLVSFDNPGTYIMIMVFGLVLLPFYLRNVHEHFKNPHKYYMVSFEKKFWTGLLVVTFLIVFGLVNYIRFLP